MPLSNASKDSLANHICGVTSWTMPAAQWLRLHTADAGVNGTTAEVTGGSYAAIDVSALMSTSSGGAGAVTNTAQIEFAGMPAVTVTHGSLHTLATGGVCLMTGALAASQALDAGQTLRIPAGDLDFTFA